MVCFADSMQSSAAWGEGKSPGPHSLLARCPLLAADGSELAEHSPFPCLVRHTGGADTSTAPKMAGVACARRDPQKWRVRICDRNSKSLPTPDKQTAAEWVNNSY